MTPPATEFFPDFAGKLLDAGRLRLLECRGTGAYGKVYRAVDMTSPKGNPTYFAVKCLRLTVAGSHAAELQTREFRNHYLVSDHPNIVSFIKILDSEDDGFLYVVLELCEGGDLYDAIVNNNYFSQSTDRVKAAFLQLIDAVSFCHQNNVYHRDIKPENVLCSKDGTQYYIADFGLSTTTPISRDFRCGSMEYMSPDCIAKDFKFKNRSYSTRSNDIWSLGVVLVNMITQRTPWNVARVNDPCFAAFLHDDDYFLRVLAISEGTNRILKKIFRIDPLTRISLSDLRREILALTDCFPPVDDLSGSISPLLDSAGSPRNSAGLRRTHSSTLSCDITALRIEHDDDDIFELPKSLPETLLTVPAAARSCSSVTSSLASSQGPITPEARPVHVDIEVPDILEDEQDLGVRVEVAMVEPKKAIIGSVQKRVFFRRFIQKLRVSS